MTTITHTERQRAIISLSRFLLWPCILPVSYMLAIGPACIVTRHFPETEIAIATFYSPIISYASHHAGFGSPVVAQYIAWSAFESNVVERLDGILLRQRVERRRPLWRPEQYFNSAIDFGKVLSEEDIYGLPDDIKGNADGTPNQDEGNTCPPNPPQKE